MHSDSICEWSDKDLCREWQLGLSCDRSVSCAPAESLHTEWPECRQGLHTPPPELWKGQRFTVVFDLIIKNPLTS